MASSQPWQPPSAGSADATTLLRDLEVYLGRLIQLVDGGDSEAARPATTSNPARYNWGKSEPMPAPAPTPTAWLDDGPPPDTTFVPPTQPKVMVQPQQSAQAFANPRDAKSAAAAEKFLKELGHLIKAFLAQQQGGRPRGIPAAVPHSSTIPPSASAPPAPVSKETEARIEILRKAMAAAEADAAAQELSRQQSRAIVQEIDQHWNSALAENNALKAQLGQANQEQEHLKQAKRSVEQLLQEKEVLLMKIRQAILDFRQELVHHKSKLEQQQARAIPPPIPPPNDEKKALIERLKQGIADLEHQLERIQGEKRGLEADLYRTNGEKRGLESQLQHVQGEKRGLEADLERTLQALRSHQNLKQTLEHSFQNAETEVHALRQLLQQLETDPTRPPATAPHPASSAFQRPAPHPPVRVETVNSEPSPALAPGGSTYAYQQNQAPWQEPKKEHSWEPAKQPAWEPPPKQHTWGAIQNSAPSMGVYHVKVQPSQKVHGDSPEWTQQKMEQQQQLQPQTAHHAWNYDPPAEYASVGGESEARKVQQPPNHAWRQADPAAFYGSASMGYSSTGESQMVESVEGASYYESHSQPRDYRYYPTEQQQPWATQEHQWSENNNRRIPQEPPPVMTVSTEPPSQGGMAFLQEQMANAVDDARNNPRAAPSISYGSQPQVKLPLQPAPMGAKSPERVVPPKREMWSLTNHSDPYNSVGKPPAGPWS